MREIVDLQTQIDVTRKIEELHDIAEEKFGVNTREGFSVHYTLKSVRTAGRVRHFGFGDLNELHIHPYALKEFKDIYINTTLVHEMAHVIQNKIDATSKSHGPLWKSIMRKLGAPVERCHKYNLRALMAKHGVKKASKRQKRWKYICGCAGRIHQISTTRHNKVEKGRATYTCLSCNQKIEFFEEA